MLWPTSATTLITSCTLYKGPYIPSSSYYVPFAGSFLPIELSLLKFCPGVAEPCSFSLVISSCKNVLDLNLQVQGKFTVSVIWTTPHDTQRQLSAFATMSHGQGVSRVHQRGGN